MDPRILGRHSDKIEKCRDMVSTACLRTPFGIFRDRASIVATFLLLLTMSFVATKVKFVATFNNFLP